MNRAQKMEVMNELKNALSAVNTIVVTEYKGLKVEELNELRRKIKESGGELRVVKNTLSRKVCEELGLNEILDYLEGPTALGWHPNDVGALAKVLANFAKEHEVFKLKGGWVGGKKLDSKALETISKLPKREELLAQLSFALGFAQRQMLGLLRAMPEKVARLLIALKEQKEKKG